MKEIINALKKWKDNVANNGGVALCPFHKDNTPSFGVNFTLNAYHCFSCGASGNLEKLCKYLGVDYIPNQQDRSKKQSRYLAKINKACMSDKTLNPLDVYKKLKARRAAVIDPRCEAYCLYEHNFLDNRDVSEYMKDNFHIRYDTLAEAIIIPIFNESEAIVGNTRRYKNPINKMKYKYAKGFNISKHFYGLHKYIGHSVALITEGVFDCLRASEYFHTSKDERLKELGKIILPISTFSVTSFSKEHVNLLKQKDIRQVILFYDNDEAGKKGLENVRKFIKQHVVKGIHFYQLDYAVFPKDAKDLNELTEGEFLLLLQSIKKL